MTMLEPSPLRGDATTLGLFRRSFPLTFPASALRESADATRRRVVVIPPPDMGPDAADLAHYAGQSITVLLGLADGWDGRHARAITDAAVDAVLFAIFAVGVGARLRPQLVPLSSGGVQAEWHAMSSIEITAEADGALHLLTTDETDEIVINEAWDTSDSTRAAELRHELELMDKRVAARL